MLGWLQKSKCGPIGLDIGAEGVRMLQLSRTGNCFSVVAAGRWRFPAGASGEAVDANTRRRMLVGAISDLLKGGAFRGRKVVSCLRANELAVKNIRLPHMSEAELAGAVRWECKERFGFEVAADRVHFINAGEVRQGTETRDEIILIAATEECVNRHLEMLSAGRLHLVHVDTEPTALFQAYERFLRRADDEGAVSVIVDVGYATTKVVVARGRTILLIKAIDIGGCKLDECVAKELGLQLPEAARLRKQGADGKAVGNADPPTRVGWSVFDAVREPAEALAREIGLCLRYCAVTFRGLRPNRITLCGGEAYDPALVKVLTENLDCACVLGEPLKGVDLGGADLGGDRRGQLMEWSVATGLAMRELLLDVPQNEDPKRDLSRSGTPKAVSNEPSRVSA